MKMSQFIYTILFSITLLHNKTIICKLINHYINNSLLLPNNDTIHIYKHFPNIIYTRENYTTITHQLWTLAKQYPDILYITTAQTMFANATMLNNQDLLYCGSYQPCETLLIRLGRKQHLKLTTPEMFISGAIHGDERIGPNTLLKFLEFVCPMYNKHPMLTYLMNSRSLWMIPMTNSWGYAHHQRTENGIDPNRDFPYQREKEHCMETITARIINELFKQHLFQLAITFHGGTRMIGYEWGSYDHVNLTASYLAPFSKRTLPSTESPDFLNQYDIALSLQNAAGMISLHQDMGHYTLYNLTTNQPHFQSEDLLSPSLNTKDTSFFYPIGSMNELVYPVNGGFEDWAYSATWAGSPPISTCLPKTYSHYDEVLTDYDGNEGMRCSTFLVETDYLKDPPNSELGNSYQIFYPTHTDGHIPRNIRLILKMLELLEPDILLLQDPVLSVLHHHFYLLQLTLHLLPIGCFQLSSLTALIYNQTCTETLTEDIPTRRVQLLSTPQPCRGIGIWEHWNVPTHNHIWPTQMTGFTNRTLVIDLPLHKNEIFSCVVMEASFDQHWKTQYHPDPPYTPQTHIARSRLLNNYTVYSLKATIDSTNIKKFIRGKKNINLNSLSSISLKDVIIQPQNTTQTYPSNKTTVQSVTMSVNFVDPTELEMNEFNREITDYNHTLHVFLKGVETFSSFNYSALKLFEKSTHRKISDHFKNDSPKIQSIHTIILITSSQCSKLNIGQKYRLRFWDNPLLQNDAMSLDQRKINSKEIVQWECSALNYRMKYIQSNPIFNCTTIQKNMLPYDVLPFIQDVALLNTSFILSCKFIQQENKKKNLLHLLPITMSSVFSDRLPGRFLLLESLNYLRKDNTTNVPVDIQEKNLTASHSIQIQVINDFTKADTRTIRIRNSPLYINVAKSLKNQPSYTIRELWETLHTYNRLINHTNYYTCIFIDKNPSSLMYSHSNTIEIPNSIYYSEILASLNEKLFGYMTIIINSIIYSNETFHLTLTLHGFLSKMLLTHNPLDYSFVLYTPIDSDLNITDRYTIKNFFKTYKQSLPYMYYHVSFKDVIVETQNPNLEGLQFFLSLHRTNTTTFSPIATCMIQSYVPNALTKNSNTLLHSISLQNQTKPHWIHYVSQSIPLNFVMLGIVICLVGNTVSVCCVYFYRKRSSTNYSYSHIK